MYLDVKNEDKDLGRLVIGLFGDLAPKAVNNFKVLATKGINGKSYKGTRFNRIIKRFMVQGNDDSLVNRLLNLKHESIFFLHNFHYLKKKALVNFRRKKKLYSYIVVKVKRRGAYG